ncbi:MAG: hypothetical protein ACFB0C_24265 [Leptolyngbyaceae cyanobacterium]
MASYGGPYTNDFGVSHALVQLPIYAVVDGVRSTTQADFDQTFIPASLAAVIGAPGSFGCSIPETLRYAKAYYAPDAWLHIPIPWPGGTAEFNQFFTELIAIPEVLVTELEGERVDCFWTDHYANQP